MSRRQQPPHGFTLIELMFSMTIGSILLLLAASVLGSSGNGYERVGGSIACEREARALITQLASDLSTASYHRDSLIEKSTSRWPGDRLGFLSLQSAQAQGEAGRIGDLCAVNYYLKDLVIGGKSVRCLMRGFRESKDSFDALRAEELAPLFHEQTDRDEAVAFGVVSFEARPKSRDAVGKWLDWEFNPLLPSCGPEVLELRLVIARRDLTGKLKRPRDWDGTGTAAKLLGDPTQPQRNKNLEVYKTTLPFGHHASP
jgi:prepilin-type N-terminal cleavage/methylation domain-containing protein